MKHIESRVTIFESFTIQLGLPKLVFKETIIARLGCQCNRTSKKGDNGADQSGIYGEREPWSVTGRLSRIEVSGEEEGRLCEE